MVQDDPSALVAMERSSALPVANRMVTGTPVVTVLRSNWTVALLPSSEDQVVAGSSSGKAVAGELFAVRDIPVTMAGWVAATGEAAAVGSGSTVSGAVGVGVDVSDVVSVEVAVADMVAVGVEVVSSAGAGLVDP